MLTVLEIYRLLPDGTKQFALRRNGKFVLGDPKFGAEKHHKENEVLVYTEDEALALIERGDSMRVRIDDPRGSLVSRGLHCTVRVS